MDPQSISILVVDDFDLVRVMLRKALGEFGYTHVDQAADGVEAMAKLATAHAAGKPYGLVFCDWMMPKMSGLEVLKEMRARPEFANVPFIMVTAESERNNVFTAIIAGANDYIIKPLVPSLLESKVKTVLEKARAKAA